MDIYASLARAAGNTTTSPSVRRTAKLAALSMAFGNCQRAEASDNLTWMDTVRARVHRVDGGYGIWLYRKPTGERLAYNRLIGQRVVIGVSWRDGVRTDYHDTRVWPTIGDALRVLGLYLDGVLDPDTIGDLRP
jgi:hypothetical protein